MSQELNEEHKLLTEILNKSKEITEDGVKDIHQTILAKMDNQT